ncbi:MAG: metal ABC transporter substrate-binding protein, partial [Candidatus Sumerlaeaceae bacterium]|nr:metal ABC transporter substrate-binding protein [Candidatus Sumerlaeaceae bacterium]
TNKQCKLLALGDVLDKKGLLPKDVPKPKELRLVEKSAGKSPAGRDQLHEHGHDHSATDPHFWLDPLLADLAAKEIKAALVSVAPERSALWHEGAMRYSRELTGLHQEIREQLEACRGSKLITFHHSFGYFARRYELEVAGVIEMYPGKQPSEREIKALVQEIRALNMKTIFAEPQMDARLAHIIAQEVGGRVALLDPEGTSERQSYVELMRYNAKQVKKALCP